MLRNSLRSSRIWLTGIFLNEVLSLNAQEFVGEEEG